MVAAFVLTPLLASFAVAMAMPLTALPNYWDRVLRSWPAYALFGAAPATLVLGIPAFLLLKKLVRPTIFSCALAGAIVASLPWFILSVFSGESASSASINGHVTVQNGSHTIWWWYYLGQFEALVAAAGAIGGVVFWAIAAAKMPKLGR